MAPSLIHLPLNSLDHIAPRFLPPSLIYLKLKQGVSAADAFAHLQKGFYRTFLQVPWLNGKVHSQSCNAPGWRPGQLEIRYSPVTSDGSRPYQLRFNEISSTTCTQYSDIEESGFALDAFEDEALLGRQFSGCILVMSLCGSVTDGTAMQMVLKLWADHCRNLYDAEASGTVLPLESLDRSIMDRIWEKEGKISPPHQIDQEIWRLVGLDSFNKTAARANDDVLVPQRVTLNNSSQSMKHILFYMPQAAYAALRKECATELRMTNVLLSASDVVCAFIWRSVMKAWVAAHVYNTKNNGTEHGEEAGNDEPNLAELFMPFDARPFFGPLGMPPSYLGNVNFEHRPTIPLTELVARDMSIVSLTRTIRASASRAQDCGSILDAYALLQAEPDYSPLQLQSTCVAPPAVAILDSLSFPFSDTSFGDSVFGNGGKPDAFRPLMGALNRMFRTCFILPQKKHGGIEFLMTLSETEVDYLLQDVEFNRYAFPIA
ncbi:hypothetical protein VF21_09373 [Pseudogymnoascus sp. 05NY08]|nr:hypothetical protein VF21_09373 [Pseudogymnoascus sp. 05NY08]